MIEPVFSNLIAYSLLAVLCIMGLVAISGSIYSLSKRSKSPKLVKQPLSYTATVSTDTKTDQAFDLAKNENKLPSDRFFEKYELAEGRRLAGNRCEHTDTRTGARCKNPWQEGDHFYDYGKGGATSQHNLVGACKWHNNPKNPTLKAKEPELERLSIEKRRLSYYPANEDRSVGEWRNTGLRLTFSVKNRVHRIDSVDPDELVSQVKEILHHYAGPKAITTNLDSIETFGEMFDYLWGMRSKGTYIENLEGVDPVSGNWVSLRKPSEWAKANPNGNK